MARSFKRQFQPSINSYFHSLSGDSNKSTFPATSTLHPTLPPTVHSSLLSVGMRIRKSVPEGYQTSIKASSALTNSSYAHSGWDSTSAQTDGDYRGLVPYCGILKVGGHSAQAVPEGEREDTLPLPFDEDEWSLPPGSQESNTSSVLDRPLGPTAVFPPTSPNMRKRQREDADDEDLGIESQPVSPRSRPISHTRMPNLDQIRPIAMPKTRRKSCVGFPEEGGGGLREREMVDVGDFEEAPFFRPEEWGANWLGLDEMR